MRRKAGWILAGFVLLGIVAFQAVPEKYFDIAKSLDIFATLFKEVNTHYVDEIEPKQLINKSIDGMLESLDPYTQYIPEDESESFAIATTGQYAGIGTLIGIINKKIVITDPYLLLPASNAGLKVGDQIISIDNKIVAGLSLSEVSEMLKGRPRTQVQVKIKRVGTKDDQLYTITRQRIKVSNISYAGMVNEGIAYIRLDDFTMGAGNEVRDALSTLKANGATKLILDVRQNPGGLMYEAINVVSAFIAKGEPVVSTKGKVREWNHTYRTLDEPIDRDIPLVVLIDGESASASEIVAGALQDYDRGVLIGSKTFGKGLVQTTRKLSYGAQLKVTTAKYYIPSGRCIQELDYEHRTEDGLVLHYADSIRAEYVTKKGRKVYDGSGLNPDISVEPKYLAHAATELVRQGLVFEYATIYCSQNPKPSSLKTFKLSDTNYNEFVRWVKQQNFKYKTGVERSVDQLIEASQQEKNFGELKSSLNSLKQKIEVDKTDDLIRFKEEITEILCREIAFHYNQHVGAAEYSLGKDTALKEALQILNDAEAYHKILNSNNK